MCLKNNLKVNPFVNQFLLKYIYIYKVLPKDPLRSISFFHAYMRYKMFSSTHTHTHTYIYIYIYISSSSCHITSTDFPNPLSLPVSIASPEVFKAISCIGTELLYIDSSWSSRLCSFMWRCPPEYIAYQSVPTSPVVSRMPGSSNLDSFRDGW